jgi:ubiquinol-cytochrome c reductase cytochrome b subunit
VAINQVLFWTITNTLILLTRIGARPVEDPHVLTGQILTTLYFVYYIVNPIITNLWDKITD